MKNNGPTTRDREQPLNVLLIENDPADAELSLQELQRAGFELTVDVVETADEFHQRLRSKAYDVVLSDYNLTAWTGMDALEHLQQQGRDIPFILVTGALGEAAAVELIKKGASDYVQKDRLGRLPLAVRGALEEHRLRQERVRAEHALRASEERYRLLFERNLAGVYRITLEGRVLDLNEACARIFGYPSREEAMTHSPWDMAPNAAEMQTLITLVQKQKAFNNLEVCLRRNDRRAVWVLGSATVVEGKDGAPPVIEGTMIDITERKRAEEEVHRLNEELERRVAERTAQLEATNKELITEITERKRAEAGQARLLRQAEAAEARFRSVLESVPDAIVIANADGHIVLVNQLTEAVFGYHRDELLGKPVEILMPERFRKAHGEYRANYCTAPRARPMSTRPDLHAQRKDGSKFPVEIGLSPMQSEGKLLVTTAIRDISERKRAEEVLERLRRQNDLILSAAGEGICGIDLEGITTFINPAAARMLGWATEEIVGKSLHDVAHHSRADGTPYPAEECPIALALKDGTIRNVDSEVFWRKDGSHFPVEYISTPIREKGKIVGAAVNFRDITERRAVGRMKDEFISVVGHELRTPLTSIRGALGLVSSGRLGALTSQSQRMLEIAVRNTDRLVRLINDVLDLERMESGKVIMARQICDAAKLAAEAAEVMQAMADKAGVTLYVNPQSHRLWADPDRVIQGLTNLLSNAIKFSPPGATVWLTVERQGDEVLFQVRDQGRSIPADKLESIFERFQQVDASDSREKGGTGLGLSICRSIAQQHGGRIWVESTSGKGSAFFLSLPAGAEAALEASPYQTPMAPRRESRNQGSGVV